MQLVEKHVIKPTNKSYQEVDKAAFKAKNLYNLANYNIRQHFFETGKVYKYTDLYAILKDTEAYKALPRKVSQQVLRMLDKNWKAFGQAKAKWKKAPEKFQGKPKLPKYKDKEDGRNILVYTDQAISQKLLRNGIIKPSGLSLNVETKQNIVDQVRIVPKNTHYVVEVVYTVEAKPAKLDYKLVAGADIGLNNLVVISSNKQGFRPLVVNGRPLKSINQYYNKRKAELQSQLEGKRHKTKRIDKMNDQRNRRIDHYLHVASRRIIDHLVEQGIGKLVIGKNDGWKQETNMGKRTNQNFTSIPHAKFIEMLKYKGELVGIKVMVQEESYTSKTSFLDGEPVHKHEAYAGCRVKRGLFRSGNGTLINADLNGSLNIIRKVAPAAFSQGVEDVVVHPSPLLVA